MEDVEKIFISSSPAYVKAFKCDGTICGAKCCHGWQVDIDRLTHERYKRIKDSQIRNKILNSMQWNKSSETYRMILQDTKCPMLREDNLCEIQKSLGDKYLSNTCADFPRRTNVIDKVVERTLSLTCPIAARLALLNPNPMKFEPLEIKTRHAASFFYRSVKEVPSRKYLLILQDIGIEILQDKRLTINERLGALGMILSECDAIIAKGKPEQLKLVINIYRSEDFFTPLAGKVKAFEFRCEDYLSLMFGLMDKVFDKAIVYYSEKQRNFAKYVPQAFNFTDGSKSIDELIKLYDNNIAIYKRLVHEPFNQVLENYLVHSFFAGIYPCHMPDTLMNNYFHFLALYKFFEFGLISMSAVMGEEFTVEDLLEFVERFSNRIDHASMFQQITLDHIAKLEQWPLELMKTLIDVRV